MASDLENENQQGDRQRGQQDKTETNDSAIGKGLERRDFLKFSAGGVLVSMAAGCAATAGLSPAAVNEPGSVEAQAKEGEAGSVSEPQIPDIGDLVDPELLNSGTWQEPWTWRPQLWPERRLELNVTRSQNPGFSPSPASFGSMLFSYGGISPGPTIRMRNRDTLKLTVRNTLGLNSGKVEIGPFPAAIDSPPALQKKICALVEEQITGGDP